MVKREKVSSIFFVILLLVHATGYATRLEHKATALILGALTGLTCYNFIITQKLKQKLADFKRCEHDNLSTGTIENKEHAIYDESASLDTDYELNVPEESPSAEKEKSTERVNTKLANQIKILEKNIHNVTAQNDITVHDSNTKAIEFARRMEKLEMEVKNISVEAAQQTRLIIRELEINLEKVQTTLKKLIDEKNDSQIDTIVTDMSKQARECTAAIHKTQRQQSIISQSLAIINEKLAKVEEIERADVTHLEHQLAECAQTITDKEHMLVSMSKDLEVRLAQLEKNTNAPIFEEIVDLQDQVRAVKAHNRSICTLHEEIQQKQQMISDMRKELVELAKHSAAIEINLETIIKRTGSLKSAQEEEQNYSDHPSCNCHLRRKRKAKPYGKAFLGVSSKTL